MKQELKEKGISYGDIGKTAKAAGLSRATVQAVFQGRTGVSLDARRRVAESLAAVREANQVEELRVSAMLANMLQP